MNDQIREEILSKITKLHDDVEPTKETQISKIQNLIKIVSEYEEIYCSYVPSGKFKLNFEEISETLKDVEFSFPLLVLNAKDSASGGSSVPASYDFVEQDKSCRKYFV